MAAEKEHPIRIAAIVAVVTVLVTSVATGLLGYADDAWRLLLRTLSAIKNFLLTAIEIPVWLLLIIGFAAIALVVSNMRLARSARLHFEADPDPLHTSVDELGFRVLVELARADGRALYPSTLAAATGMSLLRLTKVLEDLMNGHLITATQPDITRGPAVILSAKGRDLLLDMKVIE